MTTLEIITLTGVIIGILGGGLAIVLSLGTVAALFVALGRRDQRLLVVEESTKACIIKQESCSREVQRIEDVERRHSEWAKEGRDGIARSHAAMSASERWQATVDAKMNALLEKVSDITAQLKKEPRV